MLTPVLSASIKEEARALKAEASRLKQRYVAEAIARSHESKDVMTRVMKKSARGAKTPCLSALGSSAVTPTEGGKCSVEPIDPSAAGEALPVEGEPLSGVASSERILVFVSFSMPEASITQLLESLKDNPEVTLVLRGLIDDSMEKTARYINDIKGVFEINPEQFERYNIQVVPTFIVFKKDVPVVRVSGNITLSHAKELFEKKVPHE